MSGAEELLGDWVGTRYARAFRTAVLICGNPADAEEAVQDAFLRAWRFRDALPTDDRRDAWLYRVLVNACYSKLRKEVPIRDRERDRIVDDDGGLIAVECIAGVGSGALGHRGRVAVDAARSARRRSGWS